MGLIILMVHRTRVKICGVGHVEDALIAARAGADSIGMIFHTPAKRNISLERAGEIVKALPPFVTPVGLFVDQSVDRIREVARSLGLRHIQLHGVEPPELIAELASANPHLRNCYLNLNVTCRCWLRRVGRPAATIRRTASGPVPRPFEPTLGRARRSARPDPAFESRLISARTFGRS